MGRQIKLDTSRVVHNGPWNSQAALSEALAEREAFLEKHPHCRSFQREIDRVLDKAGSPENRMTVLAMLMEGKLLELHHKLKKLNGILLKALA